MNKYIITIIGVFSIIIIINCYLYWNTNMNIELFSNPIKTESIILVGDSILKNNSYVLEEKSVEKLLSTKTDAHIYCFAVNDSIIKDAQEQVNILPQHLNEPSTCIFLSIGGNDILKGIDPVSSIFRQYMDLVDLMKERMDKTKIVLINLYYPTDEKYEKYYSSIKRWNELVDAYAKDNDLKLLDASTILFKEEDFTSEIEPSIIGGEKLANEISKISI
jgi:lysophospholipase L1-like esterase